MARTLRARAPDPGTITKPHVLIFGPPGVRKTWETLGFHKLYYIDTEGGAELPAYQERLKAGGGAYMGKAQGSQDFATVIDEIQALATVQHDYLTLAIDSFSKLYNLAAAAAEERVGNDFGKDKKEAQKPTRQLVSWLERLDLNVILICHQKPIWVRHGKELVQEGHTFDAWDKMEYDLHLCLQVSLQGDKSFATPTKSRMEGFPKGQRFPWTFAEFEARAGSALMLRPPKSIELPTKEEVAEVRRLLGIVKVPEDWESKVLAKAGVVSWEDMDRDKVRASIKHLSGMVQPEAA